MLQNFFRKQIVLFDRLDEQWESAKTSRFISNLVIGFFLIGMLIAYLDYLGFVIPLKKISGAATFDWTVS